MCCTKELQRSTSRHYGRLLRQWNMLYSTVWSILKWRLAWITLLPCHKSNSSQAKTWRVQETCLVLGDNKERHVLPNRLRKYQHIHGHTFSLLCAVINASSCNKCTVSMCTKNQCFGTGYFFVSGLEQHCLREARLVNAVFFRGRQ